MTPEPFDPAADTAGPQRPTHDAAPAEDTWHGLPRAAGGVFAASGAVSLAGPGLGAAVALGLLALRDAPLAAALGGGAGVVALAVVAGAWLGVRRWRATAWMLGRDGLHMRRGIWWRCACCRSCWRCSPTTVSP
uniref:Uncharacterized protein n=1 Tax=Coralloluteibacterium stylophorae TaxID=1776034 RepID=A0A8J8B045_9GAMM